MVCIKKLHSQHFVLTKPRFTALCEVLAMEVCKPQCQLTEEYHRSFETYLLTEKVLFFGVHKNPPMKMSCYCGQTRKHPNFGIHYLDVFDERNSHFTTVPYSCLREKNVLLRARFPVRRVVGLALFIVSPTFGYNIAASACFDPLGIRYGWFQGLTGA